MEEQTLEGPLEVLSLQPAMTMMLQSMNTVIEDYLLEHPSWTLCRFFYHHFTVLFVGLPRQPKYNHLKELHTAIKLCGHTLVDTDPTVTNLGNYEQV